MCILSPFFTFCQVWRRILGKRFLSVDPRDSRLLATEAPFGPLVLQEAANEVGAFFVFLLVPVWGYGIVRFVHRNTSYWIHPKVKGLRGRFLSACRLQQRDNAATLMYAYIYRRYIGSFVVDGQPLRDHERQLSSSLDKHPKRGLYCTIFSGEYLNLMVSLAVTYV